MIKKENLILIDVSPRKLVKYLAIILLIFSFNKEVKSTSMERFENYDELAIDLPVQLVQFHVMKSDFILCWHALGTYLGYKKVCDYTGNAADWCDCDDEIQPGSNCTGNNLD
ncbi:MAG: hypothetical protein ACI9Z3_002110 [Roseivirga sp.]|jgi:hypothetical protein